MKGRAGDNEFCTDDPQIRKRDPDFPVSKGKEYEFTQPSTVAHIGKYLLTAILRTMNHHKTE